MALALTDISRGDVTYDSVGCIAIGVDFRVVGNPTALSGGLTWDFRRHRPTRPNLSFMPFDTELARRGGLIEGTTEVAIKAMRDEVHRNVEQLNAEWNEAERRALDHWAELGYTVENSWLGLMQQIDPASALLASLARFDEPWTRTSLERAKGVQCDITIPVIADHYVRLLASGERAVIKSLSKMMDTSPRTIRDQLAEAERLGLLTPPDSAGVASRKPTEKLPLSVRDALVEYGANQYQGAHMPNIKCLWRLQELFGDHEPAFAESLKSHPAFPHIEGEAAEALVRKSLELLRE